MMRLIKFLFGLSVGAAAGVLFAPKSGRELRRQLRESDLVSSVADRLLPAPPAQVSAPEDAATATDFRPSAPASDQDEPAATATEPVEPPSLAETTPVDAPSSAAELSTPTVIAAVAPLTEFTPPEAHDVPPSEPIVWEAQPAEPTGVDSIAVEGVQPIEVESLATVEEPSSGAVQESIAGAGAKAPSDDERDASAAFAAEVAEVETPLEPSAWSPVEPGIGMPFAPDASEPAEEAALEDTSIDEAPPEEVPLEEVPYAEATPEEVPLEEAETHETLAEETETEEQVAPESAERPPAIEQAEAAATVVEEAELSTPPADEPLLTEPSADVSPDGIVSPAESFADETMPAETEAGSVAKTEAETDALWTPAPVTAVPPAPLAPEPSMWAPIEIAREPMAPSLVEPPAPAEEAAAGPAGPEAAEESPPEAEEWPTMEEEVPEVVGEPSGALAEEGPGLNEPPAEAPADDVSAPFAVESKTAEAVREPADSDTPALQPPTGLYPAEDLLARIEATRAALAADLAAPFGSEQDKPTAPDAPEADAVATAADSPEAWPAGEPDEIAPPLVAEGPSEVEAWAVAAEPAASSAAAEPADEGPTTPTLADQAPAATQAEHPAPGGAPFESGTIDQAEMRRRIEETRARLKAKAFDAMMSGESALLRHGTGTRPVPTAPDERVEPEIDSTIDKSLTQEDF